MDENPVRKIAQWYDTLASSYDELYGEEQALKHKIILDQIGTQITTLLDVGCGTGRFLMKADHLFSFGLGVDVSKRMLMIAKQRSSSKNDFVQATSSSLPIKKGIVDCTISISTSKADASVSQFIKEDERISSKNSILAVTFFEQPVNSRVVPKAGVLFSSKINDRETLYVFRLNPTGSER